MAWTAPRTWAVGEMVTHTLLNVQLRDNGTFMDTTHNHQSAGSTGGASVLGTIDFVYWRNVGAMPGATMLQQNGTALYWHDGVGTWNLNNFDGATTAALIRVGTIEVTTGGTLGADGTHNHGTNSITMA